VGDITPPVITGLDPIESSATAYISWSTNEPADTQVRYGLTAAYGGLVSDPTLTGTHSPLLSGLQAGSLYYYEVVSRDASGNQATVSGTFETSEGTSHSISSSPPQASSPCDTGSVLIEKSVTVERTSNNSVRLKARTWLSKAAGTDWRNYFVPIVRARPRVNSGCLDAERIVTGTWNGYAEYTWDFNIQATGTGVYAVDSDHYGNSSYCNGLYPGQIVYNHFAGTDQRTILRPAILPVRNPRAAPQVATYLDKGFFRGKVRGSNRNAGLTGSGTGCPGAATQIAARTSVRMVRLLVTPVPGPPVGKRSRRWRIQDSHARLMETDGAGSEPGVIIGPEPGERVFPKADRPVHSHLGLVPGRFR
jgi:hypothetical protein